MQVNGRFGATGLYLNRCEFSILLVRLDLSKKRKILAGVDPLFLVVQLVA
jgi:hypothetical protein